MGEAALNGKVVVVNGGTGGIGRASCEAAARAGASVVVVDLDPERIETVVDALADLSPGGAPHSGVQVDVRSAEDNQRMVELTLERHGRIDALVASAGILRGTADPRPKMVVDTSPEEFWQVIETNLLGVFLANRAVLPTMIKQRSGTIVNVSSVQGLVGQAFDGPYCASKFGVIGLSQAIAAEVQSSGVRVVPIMPHAVATPIWDQNGPVGMPKNALVPARVADLILFMIQQPEDAVLMNGAVIAPLSARRRKSDRPAS